MYPCCLEQACYFPALCLTYLQETTHIPFKQLLQAHQLLQTAKRATCAGSSCIWRQAAYSTWVRPSGTWLLAGAAPTCSCAMGAPLTGSAAVGCSTAVALGWLGAPSASSSKGPSAGREDSAGTQRSMFTITQPPNSQHLITVNKHALYVPTLGAHSNNQLREEDMEKSGALRLIGLPGEFEKSSAASS